MFERPKGSGVWWARYADQHGSEHREKVGPKGLAKQVYEKRKAEIAERRFFPERIRRRDVLLRDFLETFLRDHVAGRLRNAYHYGRYAGRWSAALGGRALRQIVPGDVARYVRRRQEDDGMAPATINRELAFLRRAFNVAIEDDLAEKNPISKRGVKLFRENNQRVRYLKDDEEQQLRQALGEVEWLKVFVALHTGFRRANCFALRWADDVNFEAGTIRAHEPKGGRDYHVPMNEELRAILRALPSRLRSPWVFPSDTGETALDSQNFINRHFAPALRKARIDDFSWHDLRHTFASRLAMAGTDLKTIQELMGHQTPTMTLRYMHLSPEHKLAAVRRLQRPATGTPTGTDTEETSSAAVAPGERSSGVSRENREWRRAGSNGRPRDYETLALAN